MSERPSAIRRNRGFGGSTPFRGGPIFNLPVPIGGIVTWTIIAYFASFWVKSPFGPGPLFSTFAFVPVEFLVRIEQGQVALAIIPLFTHMFLHGNLAHLLLNMLWLVVFGSGVARRLCVEGVPPADRTHNVLVFMAFYIACGIAGGLTHFAFHPYDSTPMIGASGAISGLMAGTLRFALRLFAPMGAEYGRLAPIWARPVLVASMVYIGLNLATGIVSAFGVREASQIAWEAHIGGFLFGLIAFPLFDRMAKRPPLPFGFS
ncbi:rhomboid family intramembrane serine protease [Parvularcula lutaonensis]|uniref:Rhomboid family intramembrane serine protease n=1 Tax=Parvularcula lutaonensis TaxID=491923 RepID=A0ABV7M8N9_9PROT|nr:rhomboid family intramembrane serine protease [Parvularcula lutaonensis]GGY44616.1 rhomboid family intramembrane serine protease [Parvularcula lutaonensis]